MLKIKDDVDLKELEKFGFQLNSKEWYEFRGGTMSFYVKPISKVILIGTFCTGTLNIDCVLYKLFKNDLVECVEDE